MRVIPCELRIIGSRFFHVNKVSKIFSKQSSFLRCQKYLHQKHLQSIAKRVYTEVIVDLQLTKTTFPLLLPHPIHRFPRVITKKWSYWFCHGTGYCIPPPPITNLMSSGRRKGEAGEERVSSQIIGVHDKRYCPEVRYVRYFGSFLLTNSSMPPSAS